MTKRRRSQEELIAAIRRSDAFTNAATVLVDAEERMGVPESYPEFWVDIREHVIPALEAKADRATEEEVEQLRA